MQALIGQLQLSRLCKPLTFGLGDTQQLLSSPNLLIFASNIVKQFLFPNYMHSAILE